MSNEIKVLFSKLFPFYFSINEDWKITSAGPSLTKHFPSILGNNFKQEYSPLSLIRFTDSVEQSNLENKLVVLKKQNSNFVFRGQFIRMNASLFFCGSPWIYEMSDLTNNNISLSDFSLSDNTVDLLQLIQLQERATKEIKDLYNLYIQKNRDLEVSQTRLKKLIRATNDLIFEIKEDLTFSDVWVQSEKNLSIPKEDFIGKHVSYMFPNELGQTIIRSLTEVFRTKEALEIEYKIPSPDTDEWHTAKINYFNINEEISVTVTVSNITEKKRHQLKLETSNARLSTLISNLTQGVLLENSTREIVLINKKFCEIFSIDLDPESLVGADCSNSAKQSAFLFKNPEEFISRISEIIQKREMVSGEVIEMSSGKILERDFIPVFSNSLYLGHLWKYADITARAKAQELLKITKEKYENIIENMGLGFLEVDINDVIVGTNKRMLEILDYKDENDLLNKVASEILISRKDKNIVEKEIEKRKKGKSNLYEISMKKRDGTFVPNLISGAPLFDTEKNIIGSIGIHLDISKQKAAEKELKEQTELALKSVEAKQAFLSNMSHEIRTPLNAITSSAALLEKQHRTKEEIDYLSIIQDASKSLSLIVNDILDLAKIEDDKIELEKREFNIFRIMNSIYSQHRLIANNKNISLTLNIDSKIPTNLAGDSFRISQIINNLVSNGIKFTENGGVIINVGISKLKAKKIMISFEVEDTGIGITKKYLKDLFQPFSQEDSSVIRKYGGTGLGLSISKKLIELLGGKLFVESKKNIGSKFHFIIPLSVSQVNETVSLINKPIDKAKLKSSTILLVDDNLVNQILTKEILKKEVGEVICFDRAKKAIEYLKSNSHKVDLILMDLQMPEMDGIKATKVIRKEISINIPIIGFSANAFTTHVRKATSAGMNDYVTKPFEIDSLLEKISLHLSLSHLPKYYNRMSLLKQVGGDHSIEKRVCSSFVQIIESKWEILINSHIDNNHKTFRSTLHELTPSIKMFLTPTHVDYFNSIVQKSKVNLLEINNIELNSFLNVISKTIEEIKKCID